MALAVRYRYSVKRVIFARYHFSFSDGTPIFDENDFESIRLKDVQKHAINFLSTALTDDGERIFKDRQWQLYIIDSERTLLFSIHVFTFETETSLALMHFDQFRPPDVTSVG